MNDLKGQRMAFTVLGITLIAAALLLSDFGWKQFVALFLAFWAGTFIQMRYDLRKRNGEKNIYDENLKKVLLGTITEEGE